VIAGALLRLPQQQPPPHAHDAPDTALCRTKLLLDIPDSYAILCAPFHARVSFVVVSHSILLDNHR
jgi:hypothetical protein